MAHGVPELHELRSSSGWKDRLRRWLEPPQPFLLNPAEPTSTVDFPMGRWNLYVGGAGSVTPGFINLDLFLLPGVNVVGDAQDLPFADAVFTRIECDAVLEHAKDPERLMRELERVLAAGGNLHVVTPFCHPYHEYPEDYRRFTIPALREMAGGMEVVAAGWRTGPTATLLIVVLEYAKLLLPWRAWRIAAHGVLGWLLFPLRYLDLILLKRPNAGRLGNHCYMWYRKRLSADDADERR
jgi:SAM-dependent methyltransferase